MRQPRAIAGATDVHRAVAAVLTTMQMGRFLRDLGRPVAMVEPGPPGPVDIERLFDIADRYGYWLGTPEDNAAVGIDWLTVVAAWRLGEWPRSNEHDHRKR